jgi:hypothetical protein
MPSSFVSVNVFLIALKGARRLIIDEVLQVCEKRVAVGGHGDAICWFMCDLFCVASRWFF